MTRPQRQHDVPEVRFRTPTVSDHDRDIEAAVVPTQIDTAIRSNTLRHRPAQRSTSPSPYASRPSTPRIYRGSYAHSVTPPATRSGSPVSTPLSAHQGSTISQAQLEVLLPQQDLDLDDFGLEEQRDGFFDAMFYPPRNTSAAEVAKRQRTNTPVELTEAIGSDPSKVLLPKSINVLRIFAKWTRTRTAVKLLKSFLGVFIAFIVCLIPASRDWLGKYNYIIVLSAIINHPGRAVGSQLDGAILTCFGTVTGLAWGSLALYASTSSGPAQRAYGGVLALFLVIFTTAIGYIRCLFLRFYQAVISTGVSICYICLANISEEVSWRKVFDYGIPWALGQAICILVSVLMFPSAGARPLG